MKSLSKLSIESTVIRSECYFFELKWDEDAENGIKKTPCLEETAKIHPKWDEIGDNF